MKDLMTPEDLSAVQGWVDGEFDTDSEETARLWAGRLLTENRRLREALQEIADAGSGGGVRRRQIARRALALEDKP